MITAVISAAAIVAMASADSSVLFKEDGPIETAQLALWIGSAVAAILFAVPQRRQSDRAALAVLAAAALAAAARELDAHIYLNPETIGDLGVRYRIDWWLDAAVSLPLKLAWAGIAIATTAAIAAAVWIAHFHPIRALFAPSRAIYFFIAVAICLAIGFTFDDLLRNKIPLSTAQAIEETAELLAPLCYLLGVSHLAASSLSGERLRLHNPRPPA